MKTTSEGKPETKPEKLPVDVGGGEIKFVSRTDYCKATASTYAIKLGAKLNKDHVSQMLDQLDKGNRELPDGTPDEVDVLFKAVMEDYDAGIENVKEEARKAKEAEEKTARETKEKQEAEDKMLATVSKKSMDLGELSKKFDTGKMDRFIAKGDVTSEELLTAFKSSVGMAGFTDWMQGDLVAELEKRGLENVVVKLSESLGVPYNKVYRKAKTAKQFPPDQRREGVSFSIYAEIATVKLTDDQKKLLPATVKEVQDGKHNTQTIRKKLNEIRGKADEAVAPEDDDKKIFILIDHGLAGEGKQCVFLHKGFPKEILSGHYVIDPAKKTIFTSMARKPENRWDDIAAYAPPAKESKKKGKK